MRGQQCGARSARRARVPWGAVRLVDIGHADVQAWVTKLTKTLAASTVRQIYLVLAGLAKYAVRDGRLSRNPC